MRQSARKKQKVVVSNPEKVLYPAGKFTKADVVDYYIRAARFLLPHFRNRPVTLKRYPSGVHGEAFYEKDAPAFTPNWVKTFPVPRREGGPDLNYILINDVATLTWAANMAALELHPFLHRVPHIDQPTHLVFDLDPGEGTNIVQCAEVAFLLRDVLSKLRLKACPKVSGSKGIQVYVPLNTRVTYSAAQPFARAIAELLEKTHPKQVVAEMARDLRADKVFIDWSQNSDHKTTVGVYSLRAKRERPYVSMPVNWRELEKLRSSSDAERLQFEPGEALQRLERVGDLFAPVLKLKQKLPGEFARLSPRAKTPRSLQTYEAKRNFARTSEPAARAPTRSRQGSRRRFVVQKHAASHLHYDLRLEMHDVLKSWAVPKGIPLQKDETRTAFETEDHPLDYLQFEGTIPEGEYGGGTVMVWDIGTYELIEGNYWKGALSIYLMGKKLKGQWLLQRTGSKGERRKWLLRKMERSAKPFPGTQEQVSALTDRSMEQIAADKKAVRRGHATSRAALRESRIDYSTGSSFRRLAEKSTRDHVRSPDFVKPMKATVVSHLPEGEDWIYEIKWDGYRTLAVKYGATVRLLSAKEKNLTSDFPTVAAAVGGIMAESALIDGEIVAVDPRGCPSFQALQHRASSGPGWQIVYYAFDLLHLDGKDWTGEPLHVRKAKLREILKASAVRYNDELHGEPDAIVRTVKAAGLEGVVAKQRNSTYRPGTRVRAWLKLKLSKMQEFVVGGYKPDGRSFQSVLVGYYLSKELIFCGKVRQGLNRAVRASLLKAMQPLLTRACPFANLPTSRKSHFGEGITPEEMQNLCWLQPVLVAQISFAEWTNYGLLRHATFEGLREDKEAREVTREIIA